MILFEESGAGAVRGGEMEVAARRIAVRAFPYWGEVGPPPFRFDPVERRFFSRRREGTVLVGPHEVEAWRSSLARFQAGPVLVGPSNAVEEIRGAYRAAAEGALASGRAVYLLDPAPAGLPSEPGRACAALFCWIPGWEVPRAAISAALARGIPAGFLLPLLPGWTARHDTVEDAVAQAQGAGARFVAPILPARDGAARRSIVEAHGEVDPASDETFFERVHHGDWTAELPSAQIQLRDACVRGGLASVPPRPVGSSEPAGNAVAAGRLEERAQALTDEHRACLLQAAARWIVEWGRDLTPVVREGNFRKVFPFGDEVARDAEEALTGSGT